MNNYNNDKKKRVALICPTLSRGGAERIVGLLSNHIVDYTEDLFIFLFDGKEVTYSYSGTIVDLEFKSIQLSRDRIKILNKVKPFIDYLRLVKKLKKIKNKYKIDVSISFMDTPNILNILSRTKDRILLSVRTNKSAQKLSTQISKKRKVEMFFMKKIYRFSDGIISISEGVKNDLVNNFKIKESMIKTIYNFIDIDDILTKSEEPLPIEYQDFFNNHDVIINIGRLEYEKNQINILHEFSRINTDFPNTRLVIIGSGTLENKLRVTINELGLVDDVIIIPYTKNPFKYLARSKIFVLNSIYEGFGNVILEAMVCNIPVISTDCMSGPREIIAGNSDYDIELLEMKVYDKGILIPAHNKENVNKNWLYQAIELLLSDSILHNRISESARLYIYNNHLNEYKKNQWLEEINKDTEI